MWNFFAIVVLNLFVPAFSQAAIFDLSSAQFDQDSGNGGDVYVCDDGRPLEIFDVYEGRKYRGLVVNLGDATLDVSAKVDRAFSRLYGTEPLLSNYYRRTAAAFFRKVRFLRNVSLPDFPDTGNTYLERGCRTEQVAVVNNPLLDTEPLYDVNEDLWDKLDSDNRAVLIMHLVVLQHRLSIGDKNSQPARLINSFVFSEKYQTMSLEDSREFWKSLFLKAQPDPLKLMGFQLKAPREIAEENGNISGEILCRGENIAFLARFRFEFASHCYINFTTGVVLNASGQVLYLGSHLQPRSEIQLTNGRKLDCEWFELASPLFGDESLTCNTNETSVDLFGNTVTIIPSSWGYDYTVHGGTLPNGKYVEPFNSVPSFKPQVITFDNLKLPAIGIVLEKRFEWEKSRMVIKLEKLTTVDLNPNVQAKVKNVMIDPLAKKVIGFYDGDVKIKNPDGSEFTTGFAIFDINGVLREGASGIVPTKRFGYLDVKEFSTFEDGTLKKARIWNPIELKLPTQTIRIEHDVCFEESGWPCGYLGE